MELNLNQVIDQVAKDKGIDRQVLVGAIEASILAAAKKVFGAERILEAQFNHDIGQVELFQYMTVMETVENNQVHLSIPDAQLVDPEAQPGDELGFQIFYREEDEEKARIEDEKYGDLLGIKSQRRAFGRIAAQTAKQVIIQRVREAEREIVFDEYKDRKTEIITGTARRFERGDIVVDLGRTEAVLERKEQVPKESYRAGDRVQAFVLDVCKDSKGPQIKLSRRHPGLIVKLFEMEVPEIAEGIVRIVGVAREPGERTKIAVASRDSDVDPVGACVGMKGSRVQNVVQELRGEKIDIVPWSDDIARFVCNAIAPAEVSRVLIDEDAGVIELVLPDDQLALGIGRRGCNVRLASQLVGWKIDLYSESRISEMKEEIRKVLLALPGLDESTVEYIFKLGFHSIDNLLDADEMELAQIHGLDLSKAQQIQQAVWELKRRKERESLENARRTAEAARLGLPLEVSEFRAVPEAEEGYEPSAPPEGETAADDQPAEGSSGQATMAEPAAPPAADEERDR